MYKSFKIWPILLTSKCKRRLKKGRQYEAVEIVDCICMCMCVVVSWVTDGHRHLWSWLRFRVQLLPHLRRQQLKLLRTDLWLVGGWREPNTPPAVCQYVERQWKIRSWMQHTAPHLTTTWKLTWWHSHDVWQHHVAAIQRRWLFDMASETSKNK